MKVALISFDFPPMVGGVQQYLGEIARRVARHYDLVVITPVPGQDAGAPYRRLVVPSRHPLAFARALMQVRPHQVLVGHVHPRLLLAAALCRPGRYAVLVYGNDILASQGRWHRPLVHAWLRHARPLITISVPMAQRLVRLGLPSPVVVRPGVDPRRFTPPETPPPLPWTLLTVGRLVSRKGVDTVLLALARLRGQFANLRYRIVGDGPERARLTRLVKDLGLQAQVDFSGYVPDEQLPAVYRRAHIFVMPVREETGSVEGFGIVYLEASASGLPVIAAHSGGAIDAVVPGETGLLVPPDDPQALARAVAFLITHPELRDAMGRKGRRWVEREMNWDRAARELMEALREGVR